MKTRFIILMGVSSSGKTTVGKALASQLGWDFYDADDFHPPANIAKMAGGTPLNDDDRRPWLDALHDRMAACLKENRPGVMACSALKESFRQTLLRGKEGVLIVYLKGDYDLIQRRMAKRPGHFMKPVLLQSQFEALEEPTEAMTVDIALPVEEIVERIATAVN